MGQNYLILYFISVIVWLFPPIRQYKTRFFWFFLTLAFMDPVTVVLGRSFGIVLGKLYVPFIILCFFTVIDYKKISKPTIALFLVILVLGYFSFVNFWEYSPYFMTVMQLLILIVLIKHSFAFVMEKGSINIFHVLLVFYQTMNVLKFFGLINYFVTGFWFFYLTTILQIFLGIFFALYREDNQKLLIKITSPKQLAD